MVANFWISRKLRLASQEVALVLGHHQDRTPTHGYEPTRRGRDGGVREELAAGASSKMGKSAFGGKPEVQPRRQERQRPRRMKSRISRPSCSSAVLNANTSET